MTSFHFSITKALREAWVLFRTNLWLFLILSLVTCALQFATQGKHVPWFVMAIGSIAAFVWSYIFLRITLRVVRERKIELSMDTFKKELPSVKDFFMLIILSILTTVIIVLGFVLLVIPGIYLLIRLCFSSLSYVDKKETIKKTIHHSWDITKGDAFWTIILVLLLMAVLMLIGILLFGVGLLVAYPLVLIFFVLLYQSLDRRGGSDSSVPLPEPLSSSA